MPANMVTRSSCSNAIGCHFIAYEYQGVVSGQQEAPSLKVTTLEDVVNSIDGEISIREAIFYAMQESEVFL